MGAVAHCELCGIFGLLVKMWEDDDDDDDAFGTARLRRCIINPRGAIFTLPAQRATRHFLWRARIWFRRFFDALPAKNMLHLFGIHFRVYFDLGWTHCGRSSVGRRT